MAEKNEISRQFDEIYAEHNDPEERVKRKILENRKKRVELKKKETGL